MYRRETEFGVEVEADLGKPHFSTRKKNPGTVQATIHCNGHPSMATSAGGSGTFPAFFSLFGRVTGAQTGSRRQETNRDLILL